MGGRIISDKVLNAIEVIFCLLDTGFRDSVIILL